MAQTEAQLRANKKYREEKLESITFRVPKGNKARIQAHARRQRGVYQRIHLPRDQ